MIVAAVFSELLHYHVARFRGLMDLGLSQGHTVHLYAMRRDYPGLPSFPYHEMLGDRVSLVCPEAEADINGLSAQKRLLNEMARRHPDAVLIPGYNQLYARRLLTWCRERRVGAVLMSESRAADYRRRPWREWAKRVLISQFDAALVGGQPHVAYAAQMGIPPEAIFTGYNVVDNDFWVQETDRIRQSATTWREQLKLPPHYFITASRFVPKKNLVRLIEAYAHYAAGESHPWHLVLAGDGPQADRLQTQVRQHGLDELVHFPGYLATANLARFFALAGGFIHPSHESEQWGLVVNEAMAARLPVLVSRTIGCAVDLVREGQTGFTFEPLDVPAMATAMRSLARMESAVRAELGRQARSHIQQYGPTRFAAGGLKAAEVACQRARRRPSLAGRLALLAVR